MEWCDKYYTFGFKYFVPCILHSCDETIFEYKDNLVCLAPAYTGRLTYCSSAW